jgi:hypothetical protein
MPILNYSHPLTPDQREQIAALVGDVLDVRTIPVQIDQTQPLDVQVVALADAAALSPEEWQTVPLIVNLPELAAVAAVLLAELHGRIGHFPTIVCLRPVPDSTPPRYEVSELLNLQTLREHARQRR